MIDYRDLLKRYIRHVGKTEGYNFIGLIKLPDDPDWTDPDMVEWMKSKVRFTVEEIEELGAAGGRMSDVRKDLEDYLRERLNTLGDDMMWRCQEADLKPADWHAMLILALMQGAANVVAQSMPARADRELVKGFHELIVYARQKVRERERQERREQ